MASHASMRASLPDVPPPKAYPKNRPVCTEGSQDGRDPNTRRRGPATGPAPSLTGYISPYVPAPGPPQIPPWDVTGHYKIHDRQGIVDTSSGYEITISHKSNSLHHQLYATFKLGHLEGAMRFCPHPAVAPNPHDQHGFYLKDFEQACSLKAGDRPGPIDSKDCCQRWLMRWRARETGMGLGKRVGGEHDVNMGFDFIKEPGNTSNMPFAGRLFWVMLYNSTFFQFDAVRVARAVDHVDPDIRWGKFQEEWAALFDSKWLEPLDFADGSPLQGAQQVARQNQPRSVQGALRNHTTPQRQILPSNSQPAGQANMEQQVHSRVPAATPETDGPQRPLNSQSDATPAQTGLQNSSIKETFVPPPKPLPFKSKESGQQQAMQQASNSQGSGHQPRQTSSKQPQSASKYSQTNIPDTAQGKRQEPSPKSMPSFQERVPRTEIQTEGSRMPQRKAVMIDITKVQMNVQSSGPIQSIYQTVSTLDTSNRGNVYLPPAPNRQQQTSVSNFQQGRTLVKVPASRPGEGIPTRGPAIPKNMVLGESTHTQDNMSALQKEVSHAEFRANSSASATSAPNSVRIHGSIPGMWKWKVKPPSNEPIEVSSGSQEGIPTRRPAIPQNKVMGDSTHTRDNMSAFSKEVPNTEFMAKSSASATSAPNSFRVHGSVPDMWKWKVEPPPNQPIEVPSGSREGIPTRRPAIPENRVMGESTYTQDNLSALSKEGSNTKFMAKSSASATSVPDSVRIHGSIPGMWKWKVTPPSNEPIEVSSGSEEDIPARRPTIPKTKTIGDAAKSKDNMPAAQQRTTEDGFMAESLAAPADPLPRPTPGLQQPDFPSPSEQLRAESSTASRAARNSTTAGPKSSSDGAADFPDGGNLTTPAAPTPVLKRKRGRPKGSVEKPRLDADSATSTPSPTPVAIATPPTGAKRPRGRPRKSVPLDLMMEADESAVEKDESPMDKRGTEETDENVSLKGAAGGWADIDIDAEMDQF